MLEYLFFSFFFWFYFARIFTIRLGPNFSDQLRFPGNCPPTPPLSHHFALSEKQLFMLAQGRGRLAVFQEPKLIQFFFSALKSLYQVFSLFTVVSSSCPLSQLLLLSEKNMFILKKVILIDKIAIKTFTFQQHSY